MLKRLLIYSTLLFLSAYSAVCLPVYSRVLNPAQPQESLRWAPAKVAFASRIPPYTDFWTYRIYRPARRNSSRKLRLPSLPSGPWSTAWDLYENTVDKLKLFKRSVPLTASERIAMHLRPTGWRQKLQDFWTKVTLRELKPVRAQYDAAKAKYAQYRRKPYEQTKKQGWIRSLRPWRRP